MYHILVVEDAPEYQKIISASLAHHKLTICSTFSEAIQRLQETKFDFALIDINLPDRDGYSLLPEIQSSALNSETPIFCLTGRKEITDKVTAFSLGADDYLTKPFDPIELRTRIDAKFKKIKNQKRIELELTVGDIEIDQARHRVSINGEAGRQEVDLTQTEFKLLFSMARRPEQVFSRDQLLVAAWGEDARVLDRVVDVHVCSLRRKLTSQSHKIISVTGVGYKLGPTKSKKKAVS